MKHRMVFILTGLILCLAGITPAFSQINPFDGNDMAAPSVTQTPPVLSPTPTAIPSPTASAAPAATPEMLHLKDKFAIGKGLNLPVESKPAEHFGWFANFAGLDCPASSQLTRESLGWRPTHTGLLADLEKGTYFKN